MPSRFPSATAAFFFCGCPSLACDRDLPALLLPFSTPTCDHGLQVLRLTFSTLACHQSLEALPLHASSAAVLFHSDTPSALSNAAISLPALPLHDASAAPFLYSSMPSGSSSAAAARFFRRCPSPLRHASTAFERWIPYVAASC